MNRGDAGSTGNAGAPQSQWTAILADREPVFLAGLQCILAASGRFEVVGAVGNFDELRDALAAGSPPDLLACGFVLGCGRDVWSVVRDVQHFMPSTKTLALVPESAFPTLTSRRGFSPIFAIKRSSSPSEVVESALQLMGSPPSSSDEVLLVPRPDTAAGHVQMASLSPREHEILRLLGQRKSNKDLAATLGLSVRTIETHTANIKRKLDVKSRRALQMLAEGANLWEESGIDYLI